MKGYWELNVKQRFYRTFEELEFLRKGFPYLYSDYACDPNYLDVVENLNLVAEVLDSAFELYQEMIKEVR